MIMLYKVSISVAMLAVILGMSTFIIGCPNQKDDTEEESAKADTAITVATEEVSLNVTGMV